jgi:IclR family acetate operon transcriptional repressor
MRVFTEVGRPRAPALQGVGKAVMAQMPTNEERDILRRTGPKYTENTFDDAEQLARHLQTVARQGYAIDQGEQEVGVRCVAVACPMRAASRKRRSPARWDRMTPAVAERPVPLLHNAAEALSVDLLCQDSIEAAHRSAGVAIAITPVSAAL